MNPKIKIDKSKLFQGSLILAVIGSVFSFIFLAPLLFLSFLVWAVWNALIGDLSYFQALGYTFLFLLINKIFGRSSATSKTQFSFRRARPQAQAKKVEGEEEFIDVKVEVKDP